MISRSISFIALLLLLAASDNGYSQSNRNRSLSVNAGIWRGYNTIENRPANFNVRGVGMGGIAVSYEQKIKKLTYGVTADFSDINYGTQSTRIVDSDSNGTIIIGSGREELAASNIVVTLGISVKYNLIKYSWYNLNIVANPRLGLHIYNKTYDDIDGNLNNRSLDIGQSFYWYNSTKQNKWPVPLIKLNLENEFRIAKRSSLLFSIGYQKGFIPVFETDRTFVSNYNTPYETREQIKVKTRASNISFLFGYRMFF